MTYHSNPFRPSPNRSKVIRDQADPLKAAIWDQLMFGTIVPAEANPKALVHFYSESKMMRELRTQAQNLLEGRAEMPESLTPIQMQVRIDAARWSLAALDSDEGEINKASRQVRDDIVTFLAQFVDVPENIWGDSLIRS